MSNPHPHYVDDHVVDLHSGRFSRMFLIKKGSGGGFVFDPVPSGHQERGKGGRGGISDGRDTEKIVEKRYILEDVCRKSYRRELETLKALRGSIYVVTLENEMIKAAARKGAPYMSLFFEYLPHSMGSTGWEKKLTKTDYFVQLCRGLFFIHERGYIHRDLKPSNLLFSWDWSRIVITDFSSAIKKDAADKSPRPYSQMNYRAPEILLGGKYTEKIDIWALGCIHYYMRTEGEDLFPFGYTPDETYKRIEEVMDSVKHKKLSQLEINLLYLSPGNRLSAGTAIRAAIKFKGNPDN